LNRELKPAFIKGNTLLYTNQGMMQTSEIEKNTCIMDIEKYCTLSNHYGEYNLIKIISTEGYEIEGSYDLKVLTMSNNGELLFKKLLDIDINDYVAISRNFNFFGRNLKLEYDMDNYFQSLNKYSQRQKRTKLPEKLDADFSKYLGMLVGDGTLTQERVIIFTNIDECLVDHFKMINEKYFGLTTKQRSADDYTLNSAYVREFLRQIGLDFVTAHKKEIPKCIMQSPKEILCSFLQGLFDTDGTAEINRVALTTVSLKLVNQVHFILLSLGIISHLNIEFNKRFKKQSFKLSIYGANAEKFSREIGFGIKAKQDRLNNLINKKRNSNKDIIPHQSKRIKRITDKNACLNPRREKFGGSKLKSEFDHARRNSNQLSYVKCRKLLDYKITFDMDYMFLMKILNLNYYWDKINLKEETKSDSYYLSFNSYNPIIANGFIISS
jgi:intein/homing endonuclease